MPSTGQPNSRRNSSILLTSGRTPTGPRSVSAIRVPRSARIPRTSPEVLTISKERPGSAMQGRDGYASDDLHPLVADLDRFDGDRARVRLEGWSGVFARPTAYELPAHHLVA